MNTDSEIPLTGLYADEASGGYIEPPTSAQFHAGVEPEMTLPAAWWNYFANLFTNTNIKAKVDILAILAELNNALVAAGVTPDPDFNNQLVTLLQKGHGSTVNADKLDGLEASNATGQIPINNGILNVNLVAASATKLITARTIGGVSFNGTANINLPGVNAAGNQSTSGKAATAGNADTVANIDFVNGEAGTYGYITITANTRWTIPKGLYMLISNDSSKLSIHIWNGSNWAGTSGGSINGLVLVDGTNYAVYNFSTSSETVIFRKLA